MSQSNYTASATSGGSSKSTSFQVVTELASRIVSLTASKWTPILGGVTAFATVNVT